MTKRPIFQTRKCRRSIYGLFTMFRANRNGGPLSIYEPRRLRDVNGVMIHTKNRQFTVEFRRRGK